MNSSVVSEPKQHGQGRQKKHFRIASYNIRSCLGLDGRTDPGRIADIINIFDADIVALQEVASQLGVTGDTRQLNVLAEKTGFQAIPGPALIRPDSPCGTALLHRLPGLNVRHVDLSQPGREPRGALDVEFVFQELSVRIISTHLGLRSYERRAQCQRLLELLADDHQSALTILTGDINEWWPWSRTIRKIGTHFDRTQLSAPVTFPARLPLLALDRLWLKSETAHIMDLWSLKTPATTIASDHLPLLADIAIAC